MKQYLSEQKWQLNETFGQPFNANELYPLYKYALKRLMQDPKEHKMVILAFENALKSCIVYSQHDISKINKNLQIKEIKYMVDGEYVQLACVIKNLNNNSLSKPIMTIVFTLNAVEGNKASVSIGYAEHTIEITREKSLRMAIDKMFSLKNVINELERY